MTNTNSRRSPADSLCALMANPQAPDVIPVGDLCQYLGIARRHWWHQFNGKRVQRAANTHGWTEARGRELNLPPASRFLVREKYRASLWKPGVTARGRVWAGHGGAGGPAVVASLPEWMAAHGAPRGPAGPLNTNNTTTEVA